MTTIKSYWGSEDKKSHERTNSRHRDTGHNLLHGPGGSSHAKHYSSDSKELHKRRKATGEEDRETDLKHTGEPKRLPGAFL